MDTGTDRNKSSQPFYTGRGEVEGLGGAGGGGWRGGGGGLPPNTPEKKSGPQTDTTETKGNQITAGINTNSTRRARDKKHPEKVLNVSKNIITLSDTKENFRAGKTAMQINEWVKITNDKCILNTVCGYSVELRKTPSQNYVPSQIKCCDLEVAQTDEELHRFLECGIIEKVHNIEPNEFISNIFTWPKNDGKIRVILNLKQFYEDFMEHIQFKMETLKAAIDAMRRIFFCR